MKHVLEEMWEALAAYQPKADKAGHGDSWAKMCREKTSAAAVAAAYAAYTAAYYAEAEVDAYAAASAASYAADAASYAEVAYSDYAAEFAQKAVNSINSINSVISVIKPPQRKEPEKEPVAKVVSTAPERIWLDLGFAPSDEDEISFNDLVDATWSHDNATGFGIEYVRADIAAHGIKENT